MSCGLGGQRERRCVGLSIELHEELGVGRGLDTVLDSRHDHSALAGVDHLVPLQLAFEVDVADAALLYEQLGPHGRSMGLAQQLGEGPEVEQRRVTRLDQT